MPVHDHDSSKHNNEKACYYLFPAALGLIILLAPFFRGLYFPTEFLPAAAAIALLFALNILFKADRARPVFFGHNLDGVMLAFVLVYILSLINPVHPQDAVTEVLKAASFFMVYWLAACAAADEKGFNIVLGAAYLAALGLALLGLAAALGWASYPGACEDGHIRSALQYHNALAIYLLALNVVGVVRQAEGRHTGIRLFYAAANFILLLTIIGTLSRGTWLLYLPAMVLLLFLLPSKLRRPVLFRIITGLLVSLLVARVFYDAVQLSLTTIAAGSVIAGIALAIVMEITGSRRKNVMAGNRFTIITLGLLAAIILVWLSWAICFMMPGSSCREGLNRIVPVNVYLRITGTYAGEESFQDRITFYRDSLKIIKDYPILGTGGGGWQALYPRYAQRCYQSREVHNFYLKTWLETGILGLLVLLAGITAFLHLLGQKYKQEQGREKDAVFWATALGVCLIAAHSIFDFELSMPAVAFVFFGFMGMIRGRVTPAGTAGDKWQQSKMLPKIIVVSGLLLALMLAVVAIFTYAGMVAGRQGEEFLKTGKRQQAQLYYSKASGYAPFEASYQVNLALIDAVEGSKNNNAELRSRAVSHARRAAELEACNPDVHVALMQVYTMLKMPPAIINEARAAVNSSPWKARYYDITATAIMQVAWPSLDRGDLRSARTYFQQVLDLQEAMPMGVEGEAPRLHLAAGQSALLMGDTEKACLYLSMAADERSCSRTAVRWLQGAEYIKGWPGRKAGVPLEPDELQRLLSFLQEQE